MELVTGRAGSPHITSQQDRQKHQGIWGTGAYILNTGNNLEAVVQSSNNIQIKDGALMSQGALFSVKVGTVDEVTIANGSQGMMRKDVIVARYTYNQGANTENAEWAVVQGTPAASNPQIPQITEGDIQAGDATVDTSVFIVTLDGINITSVDVVPELAPDIAELKALIDKLNGKISGAAGQIVWCGLVNLLYNSSTDLQGVINDAPPDIFGNLSDYAVLVTLRNASGTPYNQVARLTYEVRTSQEVLVIDAFGSGFVSGHVVSVSVLIVKCV